MTYFNKNKELKPGYNAYIDASTNYMGTGVRNTGTIGRGGISRPSIWRRKPCRVRISTERNAVPSKGPRP